MRANANNINQMMLRRTLAPSDPILALFAGGEQGDFFDLSNHSLTWQDSTKSTTADADNDPLGAIVGAVNANTLSQATAASRLALKTDGNLWWAEMDGVDDIIFGSLNFPLQPNTYIAVAFERNGLDHTGGIQELSSSSGPNDHIQINTQNNSRMNSRTRALSEDKNTTSALSSSNQAPPNTTIVCEFWVEPEPGDIIQLINGQAAGSEPANWPSTLELGDITYVVPAGVESGTVHKWFGSLVIDRIPTGTERQVIRERLAALSGVALP